MASPSIKTPASKNIAAIFRILEKEHQPTMLELLAGYTPFQLLVMTMLSARTKDSTVIPLVKEMFKIYPNPEDYAALSIEKIEKMIYRVGFYRVKARNLKKISEIIVAKHQGIIPDTLEELTSLPGIGRKTANCMLNYAFGQPAIAVDVHVQRISNRLGWVNSTTPEKTELELMKIVPHNEWINVNRLFVGHGQNICRPVKPKCQQCSITGYCAYYSQQKKVSDEIRSVMKLKADLKTAEKIFKKAS